MKKTSFNDDDGFVEEEEEQAPAVAKPNRPENLAAQLTSNGEIRSRGLRVADLSSNLYSNDEELPARVQRNGAGLLVSTATSGVIRKR